MRLGVIGGTFNPIHKMHVRLARSAMEQLKLDKVIFITSADPPHKKAEGNVSAEERHEMVKLATDRIKGFETSSMELERKGKSYTLYTLRELRELFPDDEIYFIIGGDSLAYLHEWYHAEEFMKLCVFAVYPRAEDSGEKLKAECDWLFETYGTRTVIIDSEPFDVSSTDIRERIATDRGWKRFVPSKVAKYITENNLYKENSNG